MERTEIPIRKLSDALWEIPKGAKPGMRVPGWVFADERLMERILQDRSLEQVANVATLPGVVKASMAMPDIHWGYGFPVGGVAATDPEAGGVISPGGVGFDVNCLSADTKILHRFGYHRDIREMVDQRRKDPVCCYSLEDKQPEIADVAYWLRKRPTTSVLEVTTSSGRRVVATADHPFLTTEGMKLLGSLGVGMRVAVNPFEGVPYAEPSDDVLVAEEDVCNFMERQGKTAGHAIPQVLAALIARNLLPLRYSSPVLPVLLKALGFVMGEGTLYFVKELGKGVAWFFGKAPDLEEIRCDLSPWWQVSRTYARRRSHRMETEDGGIRFEASNDCLKVGSSSFAILLALLGCPVGNKSIQGYELPNWLWRAPLWQKRLFLAAYFGAELQVPRAYTARNRHFPCPLLTVRKQEDYAAGGKRFLEQIANLVGEFGVRTLGVDQHREPTQGRHGVSVRLRLAFCSRPENLLALYTKIGIEYNASKRTRAAVVASYLSTKQAVLIERQALVSEMVRHRETSRLGAGSIASLMQGSESNARGGLNVRFMVRTMDGGENCRMRVPKDFMAYDEFYKRAVEGLGNGGLVWEPIQKIDSRDGVAWVYDVTVDHADHNFVANGFVVHNCGIRMLRTDLTEEQVRPRMKTLVAALFSQVPCGVGKGGDIKFTEKQMRQILLQGSQWIVKQGYGTPEDVEHTESKGALDGADPDKVSDRAYERGKGQVGTLGSGNHFLEVQVVDRLFDEKAAQLFGLREGGVTLMIHSGSRGFGYQVCDDYLDVTGKACAKYGISVPDRQLACTPVNSPEGQAYLGAMRAAANYAWANRQLLMHRARQVFAQVFGRPWERLKMSLIYDVCHNIAKLEPYEVDGKKKLLCVHRKGATRAFPPGHPELPEAVRPYGQPVIIPGDMGRNSYLLLGAPGSIEHSFGSTCHGAGRVMSRAAAIRACKGRSIQRELEDKGIIAMGRGRNALEEEQPDAYKDVNEVVEVVERAGISRRVCRMRPIGVIKG